MRLNPKLLGVAAAIALAGFATSANADILTYDFTLDGLTGTPLPTNTTYGSFTVNNVGNAGTELIFTVTLDKSVPFYFQDDSSGKGTFDFLVNGAVTNITGITTTPTTSPVGFTWLGGVGTDSPAPNATFTAPSIVT